MILEHPEHRPVEAAVKALADPIRLDVIHALAQGERCVCDLLETSTSPSPNSRFISGCFETRDFWLIASGRWIYYRLQPDALAALEAWLAEHRHCTQSSAPARTDHGPTACLPGHGTQSGPHWRSAEPTVTQLRSRAGTGQRQW